MGSFDEQREAQGRLVPLWTPSSTEMGHRFGVHRIGPERIDLEVPVDHQITCGTPPFY
jgi:hypothetical protein